jgi:beta-mannosidase
MNRLSLDGTWKLRWSDGQRYKSEYAERDYFEPVRYLDAEVPGEVHLDLMRHGLIANVYRDTNVLSARWVEEFIWSYRREFDATEEMLSAKRVWLNFQQLDLVATIVLNGQTVGTHRNVFYPCRVEITGKLRPGKNVLAVHLDSGLYDIADKPYAGYDNHLNGKLHKRHWLRKPQCSFSWDWSQRLINVGITGPVRLEWTSDPLRIEEIVPLVTVSDDLAEGRVNARVFIEGLTDAPVMAKVHVEVAGVEQTSEFAIKPGLHPYDTRLIVNNPRLWWPVGVGEPTRHDLTVRVELDGRTIFTRTVKIGFRHVRINQDPHPREGRYFIIEINRRPVFCKGGNFVPADMIFMRADRERYDRLTDLALEANFNLLRVWGGGLYESDDFYDLCDAKGILVWQEFIFACCKYPATDQAFHEDVQREARYNLRRLAKHPSLVVWCGNNEMEEASWHWGYDRGVVFPDYALFHLTLPRIMSEEDPTRYYQPSSPFTPGNQDPRAMHSGDQHPWFVGFHDTDFRKYRPIEPRFPNEGGCLGPTALPTLLACLPESQRFLHSFAWDVHDNAIAMWDEPSPTDKMLVQHLGKDPASMTVEQFTYYAGLVQGEGLREYCDSFRRKMFDCASAIFWMFNDTWPAVRSWTIADYYLRRTPAFWSVRRALQPATVIVAEAENDIVVFGVNDTNDEVRAELRYGLLSLAGGYPLDRHTTVALPPNASTPLARFSRTEWHDPTTSLAFAVLEKDGKPLARHRLALPFLRELKFAPADVRVEVRDGVARFQSDVFVLGVCLDLDGETALADNFFDLFPGMTHELPWDRPHTPRVLFTGNPS